ncbi:MAG: divalent-cation tolerance protein CutA [Candidatus Bathyarchaeota archaeon]|nr:divalent-cation tolerance protein CutA [Candidatus Bathyarchaeota archaeon]
MTDFIVVLVTAKDKVEAEKIGMALLLEKLVACVNIVGSVSSWFHWKGNVDYAEECLLILKTRRDLFDRVSERVGALHSYEVPEVLALPVVGVSATYLTWLEETLK